MSTWVLILTLVTNDFRTGSAVHSVPGFDSQASCMSAATAWSKQVGGEYYRRAIALCVEQKAVKQ